MAQSKDITEFYKGEHVQFTVNCKNRAGAALDLTGVTIYLSVAEAKLAEASLTGQWTDTDAQVSITDAANGAVEVSLAPSDLNALGEGSTYHYGIWTYGAVNLLQALGTISLKAAVQPQP